MNQKIAYQGIPASYSHIVATHYFKSAYSLVGVSTFREVFEKISTKKVEFGIIPIENSLTGAIYENYNLLYKNNLHILAEEYLKIEHCLLAVQSKKSGQQRLQELKKVYSHAQALDQCLSFFHNNPHIQKIPYEDTAGATRYVAKQKKIHYAAIASEEAARLYNLDVIKRHIRDDEDNYTRFLVISKDQKDIKGANKCSLIFTIKHEPGSLFHTLEVFSKHEVNLTKIESRPIHGQPFEYFFDVDFEFEPKKVSKLQALFKELKKQAHYLKILGIYKAGILP